MNIFLSAVVQMSLTSNLQRQATAHASEMVISPACLVHSGVFTIVSGSVVFWQVQALLPLLSLTIPSHLLEQWLVSPLDSELGVVRCVHPPGLRNYTSSSFCSLKWHMVTIMSLINRLFEHPTFPGKTCIPSIQTPMFEIIKM